MSKNKVVKKSSSLPVKADGLDTQTKLISGVLNIPVVGDYYEDMISISEYGFALRAFFECVACEYAFILHASDDLDTDNVVTDDKLSDGVRFYRDQGLKTPHIHFYFRASKRSRVGTWISRIAQALGFSKDQYFLVHCQNCKNPAGAIQYLLHLNNPERFQYERSMIVTNLDDRYLDFYLEGNGQYLDPVVLYKLVRECSSQTEVIMQLGLELYMKFRPVITMMWIERNTLVHCFDDGVKPVPVEFISETGEVASNASR